MEKLPHFNRERIPERVVHAKGAGAHGIFDTTADMSTYTRAKCPTGRRSNNSLGPSSTFTLAPGAIFNTYESWNGRNFEAADPLDVLQHDPDQGQAAVDAGGHLGVVVVDRHHQHLERGDRP
jgi:hypothetical protein